MEKIKKTAKKMLLISLALMLICCIVVSFIQTSGGKVTMKELNIETDAGYSMSAYLFIPDGASADNKLPAVVTSHGYLNNKEMQDSNFTELARRGFVVLAVDQPCHGDSEVLATNGADAVYQGVLALSRMPFVDTTRIGITGHSMGGMSCNRAVVSDNENGTNLIKAVLLNNADATYMVDDEYADIYGSRYVGILSADHDEFFHKYTDDNGVAHEAPDFMESPSAQSFLHYGTDPTGQETLVKNTYYTKTVDGEETFRVIFRPHIIHPWSHFSTQSEYFTIDFFDKALDAPNSIDPDDQVWPIKEAFNGIGLIGFALFLVSFCILMVYTPKFEALRAEAPAEPAKVSDKKGLIWFWGSLAAGALFATLIYRWSLNVGSGMKVSQTEAMGLGFWSTLCGIFTILSMVVFYNVYGKKNGMDLTAIGVKMPAKKFGLTALLALIVVVVAYGIVFTADYFFYADFRFWTLAIKAFEAPILRFIPYIFLFLTYYVAASVANNCFNYNEIGGKANGIICAAFAAFPAMILPWIQYITYFNTGYMKWGSDAMHILWLFPILLILVASTLISRAIYKATKNPYLGGIINFLIVGILTITNTCTTLM